MINELLIDKNHLTCIPETMTCRDAVAVLEEESLRSAPVLDGSNTLYRGNIYRYHIYQYFYHHPEADLNQIPVTHFLKNTTKIIRDSDSIYSLFFAMSDLPYIAVLNDQNSFLGIIQHNTMTDFFAQAWSMHHAGFVLDVKTIGKKGELVKISRLINRHCDISANMTIEKTTYNTHSSIMFALPEGLDQLQLNALERDLVRKGYQVKFYKLK